MAVFRPESATEKRVGGHWRLEDRRMRPRGKPLRHEREQHCAADAHGRFDPADSVLERITLDVLDQGEAILTSGFAQPVAPSCDME